MAKILTVTGEENITPFVTRSTLYVFEPGKVRSIGTSEMVKRDGKPWLASAVEGKRADVYGGWTTATYDVPEGTVMAFLGRRTGTNGSENHSLTFVRVRSKGPQTKVSLSLPGRGARRTVFVEGRFDVVDAEKVCEVIGRDLPPMFKQLAEIPRSGWGTIEEVEPEIEKAPVLKLKTVTGIDGVAQRVQTTTRRRKLSI